MKTSRIITLAVLGLALGATPAMAQRGGGSRGGGGSHSSGSVSRSSSSSSSRSGGGVSHSSSSSSRSGGSVSHSSSSSRSSSVGSSSSSRSGSVSRSSSTPSSRHGSVDRSGASSRSLGRTPSTPSTRSSVGTPGAGSRSAGVRGSAAAKSGEVTSHGGRPVGTAQPMTPGYQPGTPGAPGHVPHADRPVHPAPYFHHPWHGHMVHCHPIFWDPIPPRPWYWPGFWHYCNTYWYDYHVTDVVVVHDYVEQTYKVDLVTYGISGDIMYAIVRDHGDTYLQVYDQEDHLLAEQKINKKYCNLAIDSENGGCWISKKDNKDALLFIWTGEKLLIYEAD